MIHHISIAVRDPQHVAEVLAELWQGQVAPFPPNPGSYVVLSLDRHGTMVEVYPLGTEMQPGADQVAFVSGSSASPYSATHAAVSVPVSREDIERIAAREGWRALACNRDGLFSLVELWIENHLLMELLPPDCAEEYLRFMQPESLAAFFNRDRALAPA